MNDEIDIAELRARSPGSDPEDPYADVDIESLPAWWRDAIEEFDAHDLRPYRPPRFADGTPVHEILEPLEERHDTDITFASSGANFREHWSVRIAGDRAFSIGRHRAVEGYTVYEMDGETFAATVRDWLGDTE